MSASAHVVGVEDIQTGNLAVHLCHADEVLFSKEFHAGFVVQFV